MINLLPPQEKAALLVVKQQKLIFILGCVVVIGLICLVLVLLSLRFYILANNLYYQSVLADIAGQYDAQGIGDVKERAKKYNATLVRANVFYKNQVYITDALRTVLNVSRPAGVYFTSLSADRLAASKKTKVTIAGVSPTRNALVVFKDNLMAQPNITNVYFPPEAWVKSANITFYVTMEL